MNFKKFSSIENAYRIKEVQSIQSRGLAGGDWIVQEKIHGTNLGFWYDGSGSIKVSRRSGFLNESEMSSYFNAHVILEKNKASVKHAFALLKEMQGMENLSHIVVFGEGFGGKYPNVKHTDEIEPKRIQKGVYYSPNNEFYAFDIRLHFSEDGKEWLEFLNMDLFADVAEKANFIYAKSLFRGKFDEALEYNNEYNSKLPEMVSELTDVDLPTLDDNICEGNVIKPVEYKTFNNIQRVILKSKNQKFSEKSKNRKAPKPPVQLSNEAQKMLEYALQYVNENRLRNVLSKHGEVNQKDFGRILGAFAKDAIEDYHKEYGEGFDALDKKERNMINKEISRACGNVIRPNFANMMDGIF